MENLGTNQEKAVRKPEVNRIKELIKKDNLLTRDRKFQDGKERAVIGSFGMQGIETIDDLFNRTEAPGYDHNKAKETLNVMATAVYESMVESGDQKLMDAVVAGSYSVEKLLPKQWVGGDAADPENGSRFASMVTQNFIDKFSSEENKAKVFAVMETLDYLKNNQDLGDKGFWERQAVETYKAISEIMPMGRSEIEARIKAVEYINSLVGDTSKDNSSNKEESSEKKENKNGKESVAEQIKRIEREINAEYSTEEIWEMARKLHSDEIGNEGGVGRMPEKMPSNLTTKEEQKKWLDDKAHEEKAIKATTSYLIRQKMEAEAGVDIGEVERTCTLKQVYEWLDHIEKSAKESNDLTINADYLRSLFDVKMKENETKRPVKIIDLDGRKVWARDPDMLEKVGSLAEFKDIPLKKMELTQEMVAREITWRLYLHDLNLSTSSIRDIEGIAKLMIGMHHGDVNGEQDRDFITYFLNDGANGMPVAEAWDYRQKAYYDYGKLLSEVADNDPELIASKGFNRESFIELDPLMRESEKYGIHETLMGNMRCDLNVTRRNLVEEYMAKRLAQGIGYDGNEIGHKVDLETAKKAVELAKRLSCATYQDSAANFAFVDGDDYSELILFKWLRYQDGFEVDPKKATDAKNKHVGSPETVRYIDTLTPSWMSTIACDDLMKNPAREKDRGIGKPLYSKDINGRKIGGKSDSVYHFFPIVMKKVQNAKMLFMDEQKSGDMLLLSNMKKNFERLNKTFSEATKAGWNVLDPKYMPELMREKVTAMSKMEKSEIDMRMQGVFRAWYVTNALEVAARSPGLGWNTIELEKIKKMYSVDKLFTSRTGELDKSFISKNQWKDCERISLVRPRLAANERIDQGRKDILGFASKIKM